MTLTLCLAILYIVIISMSFAKGLLTVSKVYTTFSVLAYATFSFLCFKVCAIINVNVFISLFQGHTQLFSVALSRISHQKCKVVGSSRVKRLLLFSPHFVHSIILIILMIITMTTMTNIGSINKSTSMTEADSHCG